jgi:phosphate transport system substrate-binding protein
MTKHKERTFMKSKGLALLALLALALLALALTAVAAAGARGTDTSLTGAGSTFVYPLISKWTTAYDGATGVKIDYSPIGSGGGIAAITNRTVDFGASDAPLTKDQFGAAVKHGSGVVQIPWALSATAVMYNVPGAPQHLKLSGRVIADIYLGKITNWNDPAIAKLNKGTKLPDLEITPIFRSDGSGTTYNFTDYLSAVSPDWKSKVGYSTQVDFPSGVGGRGSSGVSGILSRTDGGIGYADIAYALANKFQFARVQNRAGKWQLPGLRGIAAAAATVKKVPAGNEMHIVNPPKSQALAYPISTFTYVLVPSKTAQAKELRRFVFWALTQGQKQEHTAKLLFVPVPKPVLVAAEKTLKKVQPAT